MDKAQNTESDNIQRITILISSSCVHQGTLNGTVLRGFTISYLRHAATCPVHLILLELATLNKGRTCWSYSLGNNKHRTVIVFLN
jgi:hypothetical protein